MPPWAERRSSRSSSSSSPRCRSSWTRRAADQRDARARLRRHGARAEHHRRLRRPARPRLRRVLRDRRVHDGLARLGLLLRGQRRGGRPLPRRAASPPTCPGIHLNFFFVLVAAVIFTTIAGMLIGLPTLRLRGDYIAIVTLAFGEIIGRIAVNGDEIKLSSRAAHRRRCSRTVRRRPDVHRGQTGHHAGRQDRPTLRRPVHVAQPQAVVLGRARARGASCCS